MCLEQQRSRIHRWAQEEGKKPRDEEEARQEVGREGN